MIIHTFSDCVNYSCLSAPVLIKERCEHTSFFLGIDDTMHSPND
jgi:hypothetical protein